jgi:hypothetical protein
MFLVHCQGHVGFIKKNFNFWNIHTFFSLFTKKSYCQKGEVHFIVNLENVPNILYNFFSDILKFINIHYCRILGILFPESPFSHFRNKYEQVLGNKIS